MVRAYCSTSSIYKHCKLAGAGRTRLAIEYPPGRRECEYSATIVRGHRSLTAGIRNIEEILFQAQSTSDVPQEFSQANMEAESDDLKRSKRDATLPALDITDVAAIDAKCYGHVDLRHFVGTA